MDSTKFAAPYPADTEVPRDPRCWILDAGSILESHSATANVLSNVLRHRWKVESLCNNM